MKPLTVLVRGLLYEADRIVFGQKMATVFT